MLAEFDFRVLAEVDAALNALAFTLICAGLVAIKRGKTKDPRGGLTATGRAARRRAAATSRSMTTPKQAITKNTVRPRGNRTRISWPSSGR